MKQLQTERSGDRELHLNTIESILFLLHASEYMLYAKSAQLYLQDMLKIKDKLSQKRVPYDNFMNAGWFPIKISDKFWSVVWSNMTIKQTLKCSLKVVFISAMVGVFPIVHSVDDQLPYRQLKL